MLLQLLLTLDDVHDDVSSSPSRRLCPIIIDMDHLHRVVLVLRLSSFVLMLVLVLVQFGPRYLPSLDHGSVDMDTVAYVRSPPALTSVFAVFFFISSSSALPGYQRHDRLGSRKTMRTSSIPSPRGG